MRGIKYNLDVLLWRDTKDAKRRKNVPKYAPTLSEINAEVRKKSERDEFVKSGEARAVMERLKNRPKPRKVKVLSESTSK